MDNKIKEKNSKEIKLFLTVVIVLAFIPILRSSTDSLGILYFIPFIIILLFIFSLIKNDIILSRKIIRYCFMSILLCFLFLILIVGISL